MNRFVRWLTTVPAEEELFFMRIRRDASEIFDWMHTYQKCGHKWEPQGEAVRKCPKCGREQWEMRQQVWACKWRTIDREKDLP